MLKWFARGLARGVQTTRYPAGPAEGGEAVRSTVVFVRETATPEEARVVTALCPTAALVVERRELVLHRGRCILCGACVLAAPTLLAFDRRIEVAVRSRGELVASVPIRDGSAWEGGPAQDEGKGDGVT